MKIHKYLAALMSILFILSGCGGQEAKTGQSDALAADWKVNGFAVSGEVVDEQGFWVKEFIPWSHEEVPYDKESIKSWPVIQDICYGDKIYRKHQIIDDDNQDKVYLEIYDTSSMETTVTELSPEQLVIQEEGEYPEKGVVQNVDDSVKAYYDCFCDGDGNRYTRTWDMDNCDLYILDRDGKLLMEYKGTSESISDPMKTEEGDLIFLIWNNESGYTRIRLVWFDVAAGQARTLADLGRERVKQLYGMQGNCLYYEGDSGIVRWNVASGERQLVFRFAENSIFDMSQQYRTMLLLREGKAPVLRNWGWVDDEEDDWLVVLSEEPEELSGAVRVVSLIETSDRVTNCTALVTRRNRNYVFTFEDSGRKSKEDFRTQIIAELMAGNGPDILYVDREDMELFQKRGLLMDLRPLITEKTLDKVMPGVIELGTADGTLVGMASGVSARSLLIGEDVWSGDSWTLDDVLDLMKSGVLENRILMNGRTSYYYPLAVVRTLVDYNLENSFLIDWDKRESHFDDERFIRLLEYAGRYDNGDFEGPWDDRAAGGGSLMVEVNLWAIRYSYDFQGTREAEGSHYVGFPTESGNGNYLDADGLLVVNRNADNLEAVSAFLEELLGNKIQGLDSFSNDSIPVTYFPTEDIKYDDETGEASWNGEKLTVFEDGTTSLHEANAFLAQCVPSPRTYEDLEKIIFEELSAYFVQDRTAKDTAKIIDSRVQLYLDEGN